MNEPTNAASPGIGLHPSLPSAIAHHQAGRLVDAARIYEQILKESPNDFDAMHMLGVIALQEGRLVEAKRAIVAALEIKPENQAALTNLSTVYVRAGEYEKAAEVGQLASRLLPPSVDALINYATALHHLRRYGEAIGPLEIAQFLNPRSTEVCSLLGSCLLKIGDAPRAVSIYTIATEVSPTDSTSWANLSAALNANAEHERALLCAEKALSLGLDPANALEAQALAQFEMGKLEESISLYEQAVTLKPTLAVLGGLARALIASGRHDDALPHIQRAVETDPSDLYVRMLRTVAVLKPIYGDVPEIDASREAFRDALLRMQDWLDTTPVENGYVTVGALQPFFIAYHPFNNRELLSQFGNISARLMKSLPTFCEQARLEPRSGKMRIGIASAHVYNQSVWIAILKGWVEHLDKSKFEIFLFKLGNKSDSETAAAKSAVAHFDDKPKGVADWVRAIRGADLDALIFAEVGMDALTLQLAALRLAPLQCATWGHPETSGLPTIDVYLSGEALEPQNAQNHYRERLITLPNLGVYVERLSPAYEDLDLRALGLPSDQPLLLCAGSPFKYLPIHDRVWIDIARGLKVNGCGRLVFFSHSKGSMNVLLIERLRHAFSQAGLDFSNHVCIIPFLGRRRYFALMREAALMLDTLDFSGFNTALQAVECGLPYLAFEGQFLRGRLASSLLRRMGLPELIATNYEDFARKAIELCADTKRLATLRTEISSRSSVLFSDIAAIRGLENFLAEEITAARTRGVRA